MKQIHYSGSSKLISRIVYLLNRKAPLPLDGDGDPDWGTDGQVLTTNGAGGTRWSSGGGSSNVVDVKVNGTSVVDANKVANVTVPTRVSDLSNDTGFITNTVNNLLNYYRSSDTYTKTEVDNLISAIITLNVLVVQSLPVSDISTTTIYLVPKSTPDTQDVYDEYINLDGTSSGWEHIGSTQIDLSNYYTKAEINALLAAKANTADLAAVATSGSYTDLSNTPTIPAAQIQSDWNQSDSSAVDYIKNKPSIPSGGDSVSWTQVQQSGTKIAEIDINGSTQDVYAPTGGGSTYTEGDGIDITNNEISVDTAFTEASTRTNIASGDALATIWGKIKKFFSDLKTVAFSGSYNDLNDKPTIPTDFVSKANGGAFRGNIVVDRQDGTSSAEGVSQLWLGNGAAIGSNGNSHGEAIFYRGQYFNVLVSDYLTGSHYIFMPNKGGTIALTSDITSTLLLNYATPFYMPNEQGTRIRFTFTGLSWQESAHLLIFGRYSSADILLVCGPTGFSDVKAAHIMEDGSWNMGTGYDQNNGYTLSVQVGPWSAVWGIFIHPFYPNATMTMTREA